MPDRKGMTPSHPLDALIWNTDAWVSGLMALLPVVEEELRREDEERERAEWDRSNVGELYDGLE